jgi:hypothetical protein
MVQLLIELVLAPALAVVATLAGRRFGARAGGVVSAFPAIVGPVLLVDALAHGDAFAARTADGTLLGLVALSGFAVAYGRTATSGGWPLSLAAGWACAALSASVAGVAFGGLLAPAGLAVAVASLLLAARWLPRSPWTAPSHRTGVVPTMAITGGLVAALAAAAGALGPLVGGMLAALPVLASVLAVLTHRDAGGAAAAALLRGMVRGMAGFVAFCEVVALVIARGGTWPALAAATATALAIQSMAMMPAGPGAGAGRHRPHATPRPPRQPSAPNRYPPPPTATLRPQPLPSAPQPLPPATQPLPPATQPLR